MELTFLEYSNSRPPSVVPRIERQSAARTERKTKLREQFNRARGETLTFGDLADKLNQMGIRTEDGRTWSAASAARYLLIC